MSFLQKAVTNITDWYYRNGFKSFAALYGGAAETYTGEAISVEKAMSCAAAYICTRAITEPLASMPFPVLRKVGENTEILRDSLAYGILNRKPNSYQTAKTFRRVLSHHALNYGNGFARAYRRGKNSPDSEVYALDIIHPSKFEKKEISGGEAIFHFKTEIDGRKKFQDFEILHLMNYSDDGLVGIGAVHSGRNAIGQSLAIEAFGATFFARGGLTAGLLKKTIPFKDKVFRDKWEEDFAAKYRQGRDGFHKNLLVEGEWDYKPIGSNPTESQLVDARSAMVPEVARFYGITPHLAGDLSRAHFANVENLWIEFINVTLNPWMIAWEQEFSRIILTPANRDAGWYAKHNTSSFMRGDFETRMKGYATLLQNGVASINECRALEDWDPVTGGDAHHIQLNMQTVAGTGEPTVSERAQLVKVSEGKPKAKAS